MHKIFSFQHREFQTTTCLTCIERYAQTIKKEYFLPAPGIPSNKMSCMHTPICTNNKKNIFFPAQDFFSQTYLPCIDRYAKTIKASLFLSQQQNVWHAWTNIQNIKSLYYFQHRTFLATTFPTFIERYPKKILKPHFLPTEGLPSIKCPACINQC